MKDNLLKVYNKPSSPIAKKTYKEEKQEDKNIIINTLTSVQNITIQKEQLNQLFSSQTNNQLSNMYTFYISIKILLFIGIIDLIIVFQLTYHI